MVERTTISDWCIKGELPEEKEFFTALSDGGEAFTLTEGEQWDFKDNWPAVGTDYFSGICRLCCAFANTSGGVIVFGVDDKTRIGGKNTTPIDIDKFMGAFLDLTERELSFDFKRYSNPTFGPVCALLIRQRKKQTPPIRFQRDYKGYKGQTIWVRDDHQTVKAKPEHFPKIFCNFSDDEMSQIEEIDGSLPPNPSNIARFVGRTHVMDLLFNWLWESFEPRKYLFGKGGSGKTTIAFEFARLIKIFGKQTKIERTEDIDYVIFLSAKEKELAPADGRILDVSDPDFYDEESLLRKILILSDGAADIENVDAGDIGKLRQIIAEYFDTFSYLMIVDDVDTLTNKKIDPGSDFLFGVLSRARRKSKILYTLRGVPSQSIFNSIDVPGLEGEEYENFVGECVRRFKVPLPDKKFISDTLAPLSEKRPLVIESIIALRRTCGSYERAVQVYNSNAGDEIRKYVFQREWDEIPDERPGKLMLSALADFNRPTEFDDLKVVLQASEDTLRDALGDVREMFLQLDDTGTETRYSLAPLTRAFINQKKSELKFYDRVRINVRNYKRTVRISNPEVAKITQRVVALIGRYNREEVSDRLLRAAEIVRDSSLTEDISADPAFQALRGYVEARQNNPKLATIRDAFNFAFNMKFEPDFNYLVTWFEVEKGSQELGDWPVKITDFVLSGKRYSAEEKVNMMSRKATTLFNKAKTIFYTDQIQSERLFGESLYLHLKAFRLNADTGVPMLAVSEKYARNTAFRWFDISVRSLNYWDVIRKFKDIVQKCEGYVDPVEDPLCEKMAELSRTKLSNSAKARIRQELKDFESKVSEKGKWLDYSRCEFVKDRARELSDALR